MSELRQNLATREWVVIAPEGAEKPSSIKTDVIKAVVADKEYELDCPFCPRNEERFCIEEKFRIKNSKDEWLVKVIDNKHKILDNFGTCPLISEPFERGTRIQVNTILPENRLIY